MPSPARRRLHELARPVVGVLLAAIPLVACQDQVVTRSHAEGFPAVDGGAQPEGEEEEQAASDGGTTPASDAGTTPDATTTTSGCTTVFGSALPSDHGRLDGIVRAVVRPGDVGCRSDDNHVIVQVDVLEGGVTRTYPAAVNVESTFTGVSPEVRVAQKSAVLVGPTWASGWRAGVGLDYATDLGASSFSGFAPKTKAEVGAIIAAALPPGTKVSVYGHGFADGTGMHKIHRNTSGAAPEDDGALVAIGPSGKATWLLFHFAQQTF